MGMACMHGPTAVSSRATGSRTKLRDMGSTHGKTVDCTKATGKRIICTGRDTISGPMAESTRVSTSTTRRRATACILTRTAVATKACGKMESSMERAFLLALKAWRGRVNGRMVSDSTGSTKRMSR